MQSLKAFWGLFPLTEVNHSVGNTFHMNDAPSDHGCSSIPVQRDHVKIFAGLSMVLAHICLLVISGAHPSTEQHRDHVPAPHTQSKRDSALSARGSTAQLC